MIRVGAFVLPQSDPPQDAELKIPALDQGGSYGVHGGFDVVHGGETYSITETKLNLRQVQLQPKPIKGFLILSTRLIYHWPVGDVYISNQLKRTCGAVEDYDFIRGGGSNCVTGIINAPCRIEVTCATANQISYDDILGMVQKAKVSPEMIWIASPTCITQLAGTRDAVNNPAWTKQPSPVKLALCLICRYIFLKDRLLLAAVVICAWWIDHIMW